MFKIKSRGFTLIELLVVIAIIGILATIVLVSLNSARSKANDVAIKAALTQVRSVAEMYYDENVADPNTYLGLTEGVPAGMVSVADSITSNDGALDVNVDATGDHYCATSPLKTSTAGDWCVDDTGFAGTPTAVCTTAFSCQ